MSATERKYTTITIPKPMYGKLSRIIEHTGFSSVSDYVTYVIRETIAEIEENKKAGKGGAKAKSEVLKKLHALGYI
ncbi:MAG: ribbon-helix-helix domain-containing protein [Candidatus Micrarchaeia archaeon]